MGKPNPQWMEPPKPRESGGQDPLDYDLMVLTDDPEREAVMGSRLLAYCTPDGECSHERGKFNLSGRIVSLRWGVVTTKDESRTDGKPHATRYQPDAAGLKGGVGGAKRKGKKNKPAARVAG